MFLRKTLTACAALMVFAASANAQQFIAVLDGPSEAPPNASPATGFASVYMDLANHQMFVHADFSGLIGTTTASHVHAKTTTPFTGTAGVATELPSFTGFPLGVHGGTYDHVFDTSLNATWNNSFRTNNGGTADSASLAFLDALMTGKAYLNIHTTFRPAGEIRGFFRPVPEPGTVAMLGAMGAGSLLLVRRRRK